MIHLSIRELIDIANEAGVLKIMSENQTNKVVVDHIPARSSMSIPREPDEINDSLKAAAPDVIPVVYTLSDAMFGGDVFVALTCGNRVIVSPFRWIGYEHLGTVRISYHGP